MKPTLILIHGAWHNAKCWDELRPLLEAQDIQCLCPDLPGHGNNRLELTRISLKVYSNYISQLIDKYNNIFLLGHSMAGILISLLAEQYPEKIQSLIYLSAYLPQNKQSLFDLMARHQQEHGLTPIESALEFSADKRRCTLAAADIIPLFYNQCSADRQQWAQHHFQEQASLPLATKPSLSDANFGSVHKYYIRCTHDQIIPASQYTMMLAAQACEAVYELDADHSPFWSNPQTLSELIVKIVKKPRGY